MQRRFVPVFPRSNHPLHPPLFGEVRGPLMKGVLILCHSPPRIYVFISHNDYSVCPRICTGFRNEEDKGVGGGVLHIRMTSTAAQKALLALCIVFIIAGLGLTIAGVFSPAWQVVDIREFRAEHQHGLWWDCIRAEKHVVAVGEFYDEEPLHCMYKFDRSAEQVIENTLNNIDEDGAAGESEHHRFWAWQKAILFFILFSQFLAFVALCTGVCIPCFRPTTFVFAISLFIALLCSLIADGVFFLAANRVDNRFVQGMVGTYEQQIGYAFYLHLMGTVCWILAFVVALLTTYKFFTDRYSPSRPPTQCAPIFSSGSHFRPEAGGPPLLEKYNVPPARPSPQPYAREHTYRVTSA